MIPIESTAVQSHIPPVGPAKQPIPSKGGFGNFVAEHLQDLNQQQLQADAAVQNLATGQSDDVNSVVLQMAKADLTFRMAVEIRNRLIESYQEIMRMQI